MKLKQIRVDGYKNLINCIVNLGDFNVLVGPNNSGKSNLLEAIQMLFMFCFGSEETRKVAFRGFVTRGLGTSICHLGGYENRPLSIGVTFETKIKKELWVVDYDFTVQHGYQNENEAKFLTETLRAKQPSKTGVAKSYISRTSSRLKIRGKKERSIAKNLSSLLAIKALYPDFEALPSEFRSFVEGVLDTSLTTVFAISPEGLRNSIGNKTGFEGFRVSSFDLLSAIDEIYKDKERYEVFRQSVCDILDLDDLKFVVRHITESPKVEKGKEAVEPARFCVIKRSGDKYALIQEYSDGTLAIVAILAALLSKRFVGPILCVEELENCLHPAAVEKLLRFLQDHANNRPVLITTHSPYLVNGVPPEDVKVGVVDEKGAAHFENVKNSKQLRDYLSKGLMSFGELLMKDFEGFREG